MLPVDRLVLEERGGDLVQGRAVIVQDLTRPVVLPVDDAVDLLVDAPGGLLGEALIARDLAS